MINKMQTVSLVQGSDEWKAYRSEFCVASEAPIIMAASPHMKRDELLALKFSGSERNVSEWVEKFIFAKGHHVESLARPIAEELLGDDLYPLVGTRIFEDLKFLSSYDGITAPLYEIHWEHKQFNQELFDLVQSGGELWPEHYWQLEHQLITNGNESCIFAVSDGTRENYAQVIYYSRPERRAALIEGWRIFLKDLANYVPKEVTQTVVAEPVATLPGITYNTTFNGKQIELKSNLDVYKAAAEKLVEQSKKKLETDQDFANAEARIKACKAAEEKIAVIQESAVAEVGSIDKFVKDLGEISEMLRQCRINEDKQVKARKEQIKAELIRDYQTNLVEYIRSINARFISFTKIALPGLIGPNANFSGVLKNLKTIDSMRSNLNDEMARAKIEVNKTAALIEMNLNTFQFLASGKEFLFADLKQIVVKDPEHFELIVKGRLKDHETAERERIQAEAKRIADEQIEADRKAKEAAEQQASKVEDVPADCLSTKSRNYDQLNEARNILLETKAVLNAIDPKEAPKAIQVVEGLQFDAPVQSRIQDDYQRGTINGLELAVKIYKRVGPEEFEKSVREFISVGEEIAA